MISEAKVESNRANVVVGSPGAPSPGCQRHKKHYHKHLFLLLPDSLKVSSLIASLKGEVS